MKRSHLFRSLGAWFSIVLLLINVCAELRADTVAYIPGQGRLSVVDLTNGQRGVASGLNLPASGYMAISQITGNIYTADQTDYAVYMINRATGRTTLVSGPGVGTGPLFGDFVYGIAVESDDSLVVADSGLKALVHVDPVTGNRRILSAGSNSTVSAVGTGAGFQYPYGVTVENTGDLLVTDNTRNAVIRVDYVTGNRTVVSGDPFGDNVGTGPDLRRLEGITIGIDGS